MLQHTTAMTVPWRNMLQKPKPNRTKDSQENGAYIVKVCADDHSLGIAAITLKSDVAKKELGVNAVIKKGDCSHFGAVMKAKDGNTLGAELIEKHEAFQKYQKALNSNGKVSAKEQKIRQHEITFYRTMLGGLV